MKKMGPHENDLSVVPYTCPDSCKVSSLLQRQLAHVFILFGKLVQYTCIHTGKLKNKNDNTSGDYIVIIL